MTMTVRTLIAVLLLSLSAAGCSDEQPGGDLRAELAGLDERIAEAKEAAEQHQGGLIGEMAAMRLEALRLSATLLENRLIAVEGGVPARLVAPATPPDPARAEQILHHIAAAEEQYEQAKQQAATNESVTARLAETTVVTQELALAQLWLAYYQAAYGLALPDPEETREPPSRQIAADSGAPAPAAPARIFEDLGAPEETAPVEGAENVTAAEPPATNSAPKAAVQDSGATTDTAKSSGAEPSTAKPAPDQATSEQTTPEETAREEAAPEEVAPQEAAPQEAAQEVVVQELAAPEDKAKNADGAPPTMETILEAVPQDVTAFIESVKRRPGAMKSSAGATKSGVHAMKEPDPRSAPQAPQRYYSREQIVRIQLLLQEVGLRPGSVDGRWGPSTQSALAEFQRARGLPASGQPDATTLDALGLY